MKQRLSLYEIEQKYYNLLSDIESAEGELTEEQLKELQITEEQFEQKVRSYVGFIHLLKSDAEYISDKIENLRQIQKTKLNLAERLKKTLRDAVLQFGEVGKSGNRVVDFTDLKLYTRKNEVLQFSNEDSFYVEDYMRHKIVNGEVDPDKINELMKIAKDVEIKNVINKRLLKEDLKGGVEVNGVSLVRDDTLIIK